MNHGTKEETVINLCTNLTSTLNLSYIYYYLLTQFYCYFQEKIDTIHEQVIRGDIRHVRNLLDKKGWANARDHYGHSPLHKSIMANQEEIMRFILGTYPDHVEDRDNVIGFLLFK